MSQSYGVDKAISNVPEKFKNDIGLKYDRLKMEKEKRKIKSFFEILFKFLKIHKKLVRPEFGGKKDQY